MGEEVVYHCPKCGKDHYLNAGAFFNSPATSEEVLSGERGNVAKLNMERHPGRSAMFTYEVFYCRCGHARSKMVMRIFRDDIMSWSFDPDEGVIWHNARCRCPKCGRPMRLIEDLPSRIRCTCGSWTQYRNEVCLFD